MVATLAAVYRNNNHNNNNIYHNNINQQQQQQQQLEDIDRIAIHLDNLMTCFRMIHFLPKPFKTWMICLPKRFKKNNSNSSSSNLLPRKQNHHRGVNGLRIVSELIFKYRRPVRPWNEIVQVVESIMLNIRDRITMDVHKIKINKST